MAIYVQTARMILAEHRNKPIAGTVLLIGRQSVYLTAETAIKFFAEEGVEMRENYLIELDEQTVGMSGQNFITDRSFFSMFCDASVIALDVSDYEGAEIVHDLNKVLPDKYERIADFIFNGSCLDNLFDPATAIKSLSRMVRPYGRLMSLELGTQAYGAYVMYSPEWFFDFFAANNYDGCKVYIAHFDADLNDDFELYLWKPFYDKDGVIDQSPMRSNNGDFVTYSIGVKGASSTNDQTPIQAFYRMMQEPSANELYLERARHYEKSYPTVNIQDVIPKPINTYSLGFEEEAYSRLKSEPIKKWKGIGGKDQIRIGDYLKKGNHFEYIGTLRNKWSWD